MNTRASIVQFSRGLVEDLFGPNTRLLEAQAGADELELSLEFVRLFDNLNNLFGGDLALMRRWIAGAHRVLGLP